MLLVAAPPPPKEVDLARTHDAIVVGSGAAGGMAAHVLTAAGLEVLMLDAGKQLDMKAELKSMEWPYDHPRRGEMPYDRHALGQNEYTFRKPPYVPKDSPYAKVHSGLRIRSRSGRSGLRPVSPAAHPSAGRPAAVAVEAVHLERRLEDAVHFDGGR